MDKTPIRACNDHLANAHACAVAAGEAKLAESIERVWHKAEDKAAALEPQDTDEQPTRAA